MTWFDFMNSRLRSLLIIFFFWTGFFAAARILFLIFNFDQSLTLPVYDWAMINGLGLRMDFSMAGYLTVLPALLLILSFFISPKIIFVIIHGFNRIVIVICSVIITADLELYLHWGFRMDTTPLLYLQPEALASSTTGRITLLFGLLTLIAAGTLITYSKLLRRKDFPESFTLSGIATLIAFTGLLFLPIRSGWGIAPLNTGFVYYHKTKSFPNHAGVNVVWNFFRSVIYHDALRYPENLANMEASEKRVKKLIMPGDSVRSVLIHAKPNVLLIILESYTAKVIETFGGREDIGKELSLFSRQGIIFDQIYSSGDRTDKGIVSILSGYPAQPRTSIVKFTSKSQSLPGWPRAMEQLGYTTSFMYGGDPRFANIESYLIMNGFSNITDEADFDYKILRNKWGVHDGELYNLLLKELDTAQGPFFKTVLTLSSHEPFDVPFKKLPSGSSDEERFLNSCRYTDSVTGIFLRNAMQKSWWKNTLVIITADHGHAYPGKRELMNKERFRIPVIWLGGAVNPELGGTRISTIGSQTDLVNTVLHQLGPYNPAFKFSRDLLSDKVSSFAVFTYNNGYGYISAQTDFIMDFEFKRYLNYTGRKDSVAEENGKAFIQVLFNDYNAR